MKPIIGILASLKIESNDEPYSQYFKIINSYVERIKESGGIPLGILDTSDLSIYDGFILPGNIKINEDYYKILEYAINNNKPCLGICAGMQAMILYDYLKEDNMTTNDIINKYKNLIVDKHYILESVINHGGELVSGKINSTNNNIMTSKHDINISKDSILYNIYKTDKMSVISMHNYGYKGKLNNFKISSLSNDGFIESIEYKNKFIIGVQFHIELELNNKIFKWFIEKCEIDK